MAHFNSELRDFLSQWFNSEPTLITHTSGSTGKPSAIRIRKADMRRSAEISIRYFGLSARSRILLCMPMHTIAARMLVVRAIVSGAQLLCLEPKANPFEALSEWEQIDFVSLSPYQFRCIAQSENDRPKLKRCTQILLGGSDVAPDLMDKIIELPCEVFLSYGMTETLSHVAIRKLNGEQASEYFHLLDSYKIRRSPEGTAIIDLPWSDTPIYTNDLIELFPEHGFRLIGRKDNVINSGGVKIHMEEVESILATYLPHPFCITAAPHPSLGQCVAFVAPYDCQLEVLDSILRPHNPYYVPKRIIQQEVPLRPNGKIDRAKVLHLAAE